jgi:hypothetical protein
MVMSPPAPTAQDPGIVPPVDIPPDPLRLHREYVASGNWTGYGSNIARILPQAIDDVTADFGADIYERMLFDPQVAASVAIFKASILETGPTITSAVQDKDDPEYDKAKEIADQVSFMLQEMDTSLDDVLWDLLDSVAFGNKVAEAIYELGPAKTGGKPIWLLKKLKTKPRDAVLFATDRYMNLVGLFARFTAQGAVTPGQLFEFPEGDRMTPYTLIPNYKFAVSTFRPRNNDPRGTSILRAAYSPWWRKQQIVPEYLRYIAQFAGPSIVGFTPENAEEAQDPSDPTKIISPQAMMLAALQDLRNGTAAVFPYGALIKEIIMQGDGAAFLRGMAQCDQQITKAVLTQELATEEGQHMARAAAEVHQDVLDTLVRQGKLSASQMMRKQIFRKWVAVNYGQDMTHLAPVADFGGSEERDQPAMWQSAAALANTGYFTVDQLQAMDKKLGLPVRQELPELAPGVRPPPAPKPAPAPAPAPAPKPASPPSGGTT